jgi:hypothetical protein
MTELFVIAMWVVHLSRMSAHIAFRGQSGKLRVMSKLRKGLAPIAFLALGFAPLTQAHGMPGTFIAGADADEPVVAGALRDGISLDEAVRMAEAQYHARVVRTDVQDEDGRKVYVLKLLSEDGRVINVRIDAATGRMR